jgi:predicted esterase
MPRTRLATALLASLLFLLAGAAPAGARAPQADLKVVQAAVGPSGGRLSGSFRVLNAGNAKAGRSAAALTLGAGGRERVLKRFQLPPLDPGRSATVRVDLPAPGNLPDGKLQLRVCADRLAAVRERSERNNCRAAGGLQAGSPPRGSDAPARSGESPPASAPTSSSPGSASSVPDDPIPFTAATPFRVQGGGADYWAYVPTGYDASHGTPTTLLVWLHGCGGSSSGDIYTVDPGGAQSWITIAPGGREGDCWDPPADGSLVRAAIADVKTHFNVDPHRVVLGGYSSGGDLAYRTAFYDSCAYAGLLIVNSSPFRDTGSGQAESLAAASCRFHVVHLAHLQDATYPIAGVREETDAVAAAGFPLQRIEVDGTHYDDAGEVVNGHPVPGTDADIRTYLLPHLGDGWLSP